MLACQQARAKRKAFETGQTAVPRIFQVGHENHTHTHSQGQWKGRKVGSSSRI